jgi:hypothetical protein
MVGFGDHPSCLRQPVGRAAEWLRMVVITLACLAPFAAAAADEKPLVPRPITVIEAGTVVDDPDRDRWNRIVLLATPRFTSGDIADVSESIKAAVTEITFAILATVRPVETSVAEGTAPRHELIEVGIGHCMRVNDRLTVVAPDATMAGLSLDFLGRQVLNAKQKSLGEIACVGSHDTAVVFDAPSLMLRDDDHEDLIVRHLVRIDPQSGTCSTCAWLVSAAEDGSLEPVDEPLRIIEGGTREERPIHVDGQRFTFGLPTKRAFAVEDMPPGRRVDWSTSLRNAADQASYSNEALDRLVTELDTAIASLRTLRSAER